MMKTSIATALFAGAVDSRMTLDSCPNMVGVEMDELREYEPRPTNMNFR